ncbi:DNA-binding transcriptional regulator YdaS (Cro superfamily) [Shinella sp. BE166]|uniref:carph-isopro domain-containing protein n=1 Tax=Shinella sp. BE166 TaxID=3373918 RepID=UPI003EB98335
MKTVDDIISKLGGNTAVARILGVGPSTISEMKRRDSIPVEHWPAFIKAAQSAGKDLTLERMVSITKAAKKRKRSSKRTEQRETTQ